MIHSAIVDFSVDARAGNYIATMHEEGIYINKNLNETIYIRARFFSDYI